MKTLIHIIPTLENGGAETVLSRLVEEFSIDQVEQIVITTQGSKQDFNHVQVASCCTVIHAKEDFLAVKDVFQRHPQARILAWMYKGILKAHQWKRTFKTAQKIIWNIRRSHFRAQEIYQKVSLVVFGLFSQIMKTPIVYCAHQAKKAHNRFGFYKGRSSVIQNRLAKKLQLDNINNSPIEGKYILYIGRYNHAKGPDRLLEIAQKLQPKNPLYSLVIAGSGWTNEMIPHILKERTVLLGNVKEIVPLYLHATALVFTSYTEGYPNVLVEAAVCGTPIVGFTAGDSPSILADYSLGYLVASKQSFCAQLQQLIDQPLASEVSRTAAKKALHHFDFKQTYQAYHDFIFP